MAFIAFYTLSATDTGFINIIKFEVPRRQTVIINEGRCLTSKRTVHSLPLCPALRPHGASSGEERDERTWRSLSIMSKIPRTTFFSRQTQVLIVPSPQRATRERGQRLRLTSRPPLVRGNMLQTHSGVTLDRLPCEEGDSAELLNFKGAGLFCIAAGFTGCLVLLNRETFLSHFQSVI